MRADEIKVGSEYEAKVSGKVVAVRVDEIKRNGRYNPSGRNTTSYMVTNLSTGKRLKFVSAARFRNPVGHLVTRAATTGDKLECFDEQMKKEVVEQRSDPTSVVSSPPTISAGSKYAADAAILTGKSSLASMIGGSVSTSSAPHIEGRALAGTGKTTTAVEGMKNAKGLPTKVVPSEQQAAIWDAIKAGKFGSIRFTAFNSSIATELKDRLKETGLDQRGCEAATTHGMGFSAVLRAFPQLRGRKVDDYRTSRILGELLNRDPWEIQKKDGMLLNAVESLVSLCKQTLCETTDDSFHGICSHYDVDMTGVDRNAAYEYARQVLDVSEDPDRGGMIDFDDMCWIPLIRNLSIYKTDLLIIDESQDLNRCRQELCKRAGHRVLFIGDKNQAIYGFAGADDKSMDRMRDDLDEMGGCDTFPLTVTRRCGKSIVEEARKIVPDFEAHESNPEGSVGDGLYSHYRLHGQMVERDWEKTYAATVRPRDMILCRTNAPLVSQCFRFLRHGVAANIQGRNIGAGLTSLIKKLKCDTVTDLKVKLQEWCEREVSDEQAKKMPSEAKIINTQDKHDCILCFTEGFSSVSQVVEKIQSVFTDDRKSSSVRLSSIHKSKGLEADSVYFLMPEGAGCPHQLAKQEWQYQQEINLKYVGITRAINNLTFVR